MYNVFNQHTQNDLFVISLNNIKSKLAEREDDKNLNQILSRKCDQDEETLYANTIFSSESSKNLKKILLIWIILAKF